MLCSTATLSPKILSHDRTPVIECFRGFAFQGSGFGFSGVRGFRGFGLRAQGPGFLVFRI